MEIRAFFRYTKDSIEEDIKFITEKFNLNIITEKLNWKNGFLFTYKKWINLRAIIFDSIAKAK